MAEEAIKEIPNTRRPHFFAFYSADLSSQKLKIPEKFITHMEGRTCGLVTLCGPSENEWKVHLIELDGHLFLHYGWPAFVRDHALECGDFLVFRYGGDLHFTVQIFDQTACEKEAAFHCVCSESSSSFDKSIGRKREREEGALSAAASEQCMVKRVRDSLFELQSECIDTDTGAARGFSGEEGFGYDMVPCEEPTSSKLAKPYENHSKDIVLYKAKAAIQNNLNDRVCMQISPAQEVAPSFSSSNPYFLRIMKSFNISGSYTLNIPYKFSVAHLPDCKVKIGLRNWKGESWTVNSVPSTRVHTSHTLCGGWMAFVRNNNIELGDVCIFELIRECEFRVHIRSGETSSGLCTGLGMSQKVNRKSPKVHTKSLRKIDISEKIASKKYQDAAFTNDTRKYGGSSNSFAKGTLRSQTKATSKKLVNRRKKVVQEELGAKAGLNMRMTSDEERVVRSFSSCFPSFVKIMKKFNISGSYTLKIPYQFSTDYLPNCKTEITLRNSKGKCWTVNSLPDSKGRMMHTFCGGWMAFVRDNDLKIGDICFFELVGSDEIRVHISSANTTGFDCQSGDATSSAVSLVL